MSSPKTHEYYIRQTLKLARKGVGKTKTNPLVGAILVRHNPDGDEIIGRGYHTGYGKPHAEVEAVRDARRRGVTDFKNATLYVNLEPCCHTGKTPPCTSLILQEKIPHVVFGIKDPFPAVAGKGAALLKKNGVRVEWGIAERECRIENRYFLKHVETGLPWITIKSAQTLDGKTADDFGASKWITNEKSRREVHRLRAGHDAILVGAQTVMTDDPQLTVRGVRGSSPRRVIVDGRLRSPLTARVFTDAGASETIVITASGANKRKKKQLASLGVTVVEMSSVRSRITMRSVFRTLLRKFQIASVFVEGGADIHGQILDAGLCDEIHVFTAAKILGHGKSSFEGLRIKRINNAVVLAEPRVRLLDSDIWISARWQR